MTDALILALAFALGAGFGVLYFTLLARAAQSITHSASAGRMLLGYAGRMALVLCVLGLALWAGAGAAEILVGTLGFTLARQVMIRRGAREG
ncbi:ATP synthase subunit I [Ostreiculturibacter nitratireducens]|uniref:N-ATPase subunit AtpR n=1 Tax=Ostreiculturibacter nitratireducens TaxID=3075226 RepID=UPI0031B63CE8